jgi:hypothetical protein
MFNKRNVILLILLACKSGICFSQNKTDFQWQEPAKSALPVIAGKGWHKDLAAPYDRLPARSEKDVRPPVWQLSHNTAGEYIDFETNASSITVKYKVTGALNMPHMPSTGVSGVDLYEQDVHGNWHWAKGNYSFGDTIVYQFEHIVPAVPAKHYRLYLPLYNTVSWLTIGVPTSNSLTLQHVDNKPALVLYGTSIMQGACASRPGLAWSNILGRKLDMPVINLGFSGNGTLEQPLIDLMSELKASLFVLDCMPNLTRREKFSENDIREKIISSVESLQKQQSGVPILLVEHCCGLPASNLDTAVQNQYTRVSNILGDTYKEMKGKGVKNIYLLTDADIGFNEESTVDGTHPNDIGMMQYATAYEKAIRSILLPKK